MKTILVIITLSLFINTNLNAQLQGQAKIDSLLNELPKMKQDTNAVKLLASLSFAYYLVNPDEGIKYGEQGLELGEKIKWKDGIARCYNSLGVLYSSGLSEYSKALEYYHKALKINEEIGNKNGVANNLGNMGNIYSYQSDYPKALEYYGKALKIYEEIGDKNGIAINLGNIGSIYLQHQSDYPKALEYYDKALKIDKELGNKSGIARHLGNMGIIYYNQSDYPKALEYYHKALKINEELGNKNEVAYNLGNMGELYFKLSQDSVLTKINEGTGLVSLNKEINLNRSIDYSLQSIKIFEEIGELYERSVFLKILANAYQLKGDYKNAFDKFKEHKQLQDSIFSLDKQKEIANLEAKRENELKDKEIEYLKLEQEKQKLQTNFFIGGLIFLALVVLIVIRLYKKSEDLLHNILPPVIAKRLKKKEKKIADKFDNAAVCFIDIVNFTNFSQGKSPEFVVSMLNSLFSQFDDLCKKHNLEKIKTIGDAFMAASGIPIANKDYAENMLKFLLEAKSILDKFKLDEESPIEYRIGVEAGELAAGVIGKNKFTYDLWGDTVNMASRMESSSEINKIQAGENFKNEIESLLQKTGASLITREAIAIKGKGTMQTYFIEKKTIGA